MRRLEPAGSSRRRVARLPLSAGLLLLIATSTSGQTSSEPLPIADALQTRAFLARMPVDLSPDGQWLAYTVRTSHRFPTFANFFAPRGVPGESFESQVRVTHTGTGDTRELTAATVNSWAPAWSPNGSRLAFYSDSEGVVHLWVWDPATGRARRVSNEVARPAWNWDTPRWTPDGRSIVTKLLPAGTTVEQQDLLARRTSPEPASNEDSLTARVFRRDAASPTATRSQVATAALPAWFPGAYGGDVAVIDVASGAARRLTSGLMPSWWDVSADGRWVAFAYISGMDPVADESNHVIAVVPVAGGERHALIDPLRQDWGAAMSWSPVGAALAFISDGDGEAGGVFVADARNREVRRLAATRPGWSRMHQGPLWSPDGTALYFTTPDSLWELRVSDARVRAVAGVPARRIVEIVADRRNRVATADKRSVTLRTRDPDTGNQGFVRADLASGRTQKLVEEPGSFGTFFTTDVADHGSTFVVLHSGAQRPADLWLAGPDMQRVKRLSRSNPQFDRYSLGDPRVIEWTSPEGERRRGGLLLPSGYRDGTRVPLIVQVYGGSNESDYLHNFQPQLQLLATRGYAVLMPDVPVRVGSPMRDIAEGVTLAVDRAIALGIADSSRLGLIGHSYGGYSVLSVLVQSRRFDAAVASASQGNMFAMYSRMTPDGRPWVTWSESGQGMMGGSPWELRDRYLDNSPYFFLDRITTPLLLLHGGDDINTPSHLAEETFTALRHLGRTAEYVRYEGENHSYQMWRMANQMDYWQRIIAWFDEHIREGDAPGSESRIR